MRKYRYLAYVTTFFFGSLFAFAAINPLASLVYILVWIDTFVLTRIPTARSIGFELRTLAAIIAGLSLGPLIGFLFALAFLPFFITGIIKLVRGFVDVTVPNFAFLTLAFTAAFAGFLNPVFPFLFVIVISVLFKQFANAMINLKFSFGTNPLTATANTIFSIGFLLLLQAIGLLGLVV